MPVPVPVISESIAASVATAEVDFALAMVTSTVYQFVSTTNCWIKQGAAPVAASAATGSIFVPANVPTYVDGKFGAALSVIRDTADGTATLTRVRFV